MMELSRKANDQNYIILVIYSNASPTTFGIITLYIGQEYYSAGTVVEPPELLMLRSEGVPL